MSIPELDRFTLSLFSSELSHARSAHGEVQSLPICSKYDNFVAISYYNSRGPGYAFFSREVPDDSTFNPTRTEVDVQRGAEPTHELLMRQVTLILAAAIDSLRHFGYYFVSEYIFSGIFRNQIEWNASILAHLK